MIMLAGLQGSGKTTLAGKLAHWLKGQGHTPLLVACDLQRPNAVTQLQIVGERAGVPTFAPGDPATASATRSTSPAAASRTPVEKHYDIVIVDTAGRLGVDAELMRQAADIRDAVQPDETLFVVDAMIGQDAVATAEAFRDGVGFTGVVLTKLDGDARGGAALSVRAGHRRADPVRVQRREARRLRRLPPGPDGRAGSSGWATCSPSSSRPSRRFDAEQTAKTAAKIGTRRADAGGLPRADAGDPQDGPDRQHPRACCPARTGR